MNSYLRLIRWGNLLIIPIVMLAMRYGIIEPMMQFTPFKLSMPDLHFALIIIATIFMGAAGYAINDYFDRNIDLINRPQKVVVGRKISRMSAITLHVIFNSLAILIGTYLSYKTKNWSFVSIYIMISGIFWFYSTTYKRMFLVGNIVVSLLTAFVPLQVLMFELIYLKSNLSISIVKVDHNFKIITIWILTYSFFAFMTNLIREIIKDFEDIRGDVRYGRRSLPIVLGTIKTKWIVQILTLLIIIALIILGNQAHLDMYSWFYVLGLIILPLILHMYLTHKAVSKKHYHRISLLMKFIMLIGVCFVLVIYYHIHQITL